MFKCLFVHLNFSCYFCSVKETKILLVSKNSLNNEGYEECNIDWRERIRRNRGKAMKEAFPGLPGETGLEELGKALYK